MLISLYHICRECRTRSSDSVLERVEVLLSGVVVRLTTKAHRRIPFVVLASFSFFLFCHCFVSAHGTQYSNTVPRAKADALNFVLWLARFLSVGCTCTSTHYYSHESVLVLSCFAVVSRVCVCVCVGRRVNIYASS